MGRGVRIFYKVQIFLLTMKLMKGHEGTNGWNSASQGPRKDAAQQTNAQSLLTSSPLMGGMSRGVLDAGPGHLSAGGGKTRRGSQKYSY